MLMGWSTKIMFAATSQPYSLSRSSRPSVIVNGPFSAQAALDCVRWMGRRTRPLSLHNIEGGFRAGQHTIKDSQLTGAPRPSSHPVHKLGSASALLR